MYVGQLGCNGKKQFRLALSNGGLGGFKSSMLYKNMAQMGCNIVDAAATQWAMGNGNGRMYRSTSPGTNRQEARNRRE